VAACGLHPSSASDGAEALARLRSALDEDRPYDLALLDLHMPGMDGLDLAREIRADARLAALPLIMLTSVGMYGRDLTALETGGAVALTKPVRQSQLLDVLATALSGRGGAAPAARPAAPASVTALVGTGVTARVLVAEDNPVNQRVAVRMLEHLGVQADVASNGHEAVERVTRQSYALVLMDCQMPELDGFEATAQIRASEGTGRRTPIIAMTASAMQGDRERCLEAGMDDYVSKPVHLDDLRAILASWLPRVSVSALRDLARTVQTGR
jgi:CheY-like chemotaxis protein